MTNSRAGRERSGFELLILLCESQQIQPDSRSLYMRSLFQLLTQCSWAWNSGRAGAGAVVYWAKLHNKTELFYCAVWWSVEGRSGRSARERKSRTQRAQLKCPRFCAAPATEAAE